MEDENMVWNVNALECYHSSRSRIQVVTVLGVILLPMIIV